MLDNNRIAVFWGRVNKTSSCWLWTAAKSGGYGMFRANGRVHLAHRIAYSLAFGSAPEYQDFKEGCVLHRCGNSLCVNPSHLYAGNQSENAHDRVRHGRQNDTRGQRNQNAKLTPDEVRAIRTLLKTLSQTEVSKRFGVKQSAISSINCGVTWAHVR